MSKPLLGSCFGSILARSHLRSAIEKSTHTPAYRRLLALLRQARDDAGLTQRDLAKRLRVHRSWVAKVETGERRLDVVEFIRLTRALRADAAKILKSVTEKVR